VGRVDCSFSGRQPTPLREGPRHAALHLRVG
jgi:hypothetical protein